jgi:hypothetical protein
MKSSWAAWFWKLIFTPFCNRSKIKEDSTMNPCWPIKAALALGVLRLLVAVVDTMRTAQVVAAIPASTIGSIIGSTAGRTADHGGDGFVSYLCSRSGSVALQPNPTYGFPSATSSTVKPERVYHSATNTTSAPSMINTTVNDKRQSAGFPICSNRSTGRPK